MDVGIRELKARLSEYLDRAERGELIRVTDRGRPKAILGPLPGRLRIEEGIAEGWITPARRTGLRRDVQPARAKRSIAEILAEDRGE
jgi:prevent-host-death family protein